MLDGEGIRTVIWTQGCIHNCPGCHNPQTHSFDDGFELDIEEVKNILGNINECLISNYTSIYDK